MQRFVISLITLLLLTACDGTTFQSSVPTYPVRVVIDTRMGTFVHLQPDNFGSYVIANKEEGWYYLNTTKVMPLNVMDACGYAGVLVYVSLNGYDAYDLACPYCAGKGRKQACTIDGMYAVCPHCGERYDLGSGTAVPTQGVARETLRRYNIITSDGKLTVTQR